LSGGGSIPEMGEYESICHAFQKICITSILPNPTAEYNPIYKIFEIR